MILKTGMRPVNRTPTGLVKARFSNALFLNFPEGESMRLKLQRDRHYAGAGTFSAGTRENKSGV